MLPIERLEIIKQMAINERNIYVSKLSEKLNVTEETIRRDFVKLEAQGILTRTHGGAILNYDKMSEYKPFYNRLEINMDNEKYIAEKTVEFIKEGFAIMADCSSTVLEALKLVRYRKDVTVLTNSISVLQELSQSELNIISTGGGVNPKSLSFQGSITQEIIKKYNVDIALVSCKGMDISKGILDTNEAEAEIKRTMIKQANKVILLVDNTKFDSSSLVKLFDYDDIDYIITDKKPRDEWMNLLNSHNVEIIY